jgi:hypothetical protein
LKAVRWYWVLRTVTHCLSVVVIRSSPHIRLR